MLRFVGLLLSTLGLATAASDYVPSEMTEIKRLPGWAHALPSRQFSGHLNVGTPPSGVGSMYFHYWLIESENDPANDPVIFWYNGGPGASSLFGVLQEMGPLLLNEGSFDAAYNITKVPTMQKNPYSWTQFATIVAIDSPPPIGLSFCSEEGPSGGGTSCGPWTDDTVFAANHKAHRALYELFPRFKPNPMYFAGESYGGIYVPGFARALMNDPIQGLNFQGWMVGDGWTGCQPVAGKPNNWCIDLDNVGMFKYPNANQGPWYDVEFFHGHSQYSESTYRAIRSQCTEAELRLPNLTSVCQGLIDRMASEVGGFFAYNLYNQCEAGGPVAAATKAALGSTAVPTLPATVSYSEKRKQKKMVQQRLAVPSTGKHGMNRALHYRRMVQYEIAGQRGGGAGVSFFKKGGFGEPATAGLTRSSCPASNAQQNNFQGFCPGTAMPEWIALNETLDAIGSSRDINFLNLDNGHGFNYTSTQTVVTPIYQQALKQGLRVLVYEGDSDPCGLQTAPVEDVFVPYFESIGVPMTETWRPWTTDGAQEMGGYTLAWAKGQATFASIRGSGHLVPLNRPIVSGAMIQNWLNGRPLPGYVAPSTH